MDEILTNPEFLKTLIPTTISLIITGMASLFIGIYLEKFKSRTSTLSKKISSQAIAYASQDEYWGHIKVLYNNFEAKNLNLFTIEIKNESSTDISNLIIDLKVDSDSIILANNGYLNDTNTSLLLTDDFFQYYVDVTKRNNEELAKINAGEINETQKDKGLERELNYVTTIKKYIVPVLNRDKRCTFNVLVENTKGVYPTVNAHIIQEGIKLVDYEDESERNKKIMFFSLGIGIVVFVIVFTIILKSFPESTAPIILTGILGLSYSLIGMVLYLVARYIRKLFN